MFSAVEKVLVDYKKSSHGSHVACRPYVVQAWLMVTKN